MVLMSGHSKWSKIKHKKAITDAKRSKIFSKLVRVIAVESKKAGGDVNAPGLRLAIAKAREANMPGENIDRAVAKGKTGEGSVMESALYEAYGPGGVALVISALTDNRNRTAAEIKHVLGKEGVELASPGAASWAFEKTEEGQWRPTTTVEIPDDAAEKLDSLVEALEEHDDVQSVYTNAQ